MKKNIFVFLPLLALVLTGCGKKDKTTPSQNQDGGNQEGWKQVYSSNAYEHWYIDESGNEQRASHTFKLNSHTDKTCSETEHDEYKCEECGYIKIVNGHELAEHKYTSQTILPTCKEAGKIIFTCSECGETHETALAKDLNAHNYVSQGTEAGVTTFKCSICEATKVVMDHATQVKAENVSTEALAQVDEIKLQNASIAFDDSVLENDLGANVNISAEAKEPTAVAEELALPTADQEKLAGKPIVDFSVTNTDSEEKISEFSGKVKVTIPYELQQGEEPDGIAIWYLSANNEPEPIKAQYANGNVSFETDHFSYYAVVHLTPEEACEKFGHEMVKGSHVDSTCVAHGYEERICRRCHRQERDYLPLVPHTYECTQRVDATATAEGLVHYECKICKDAYDVVIPKVVNNGRGFYTNLIYTAMSPEWKMYESTTEEGQNRTFEQYEGLDNEGEPFTYRSDGYATYKGYRYDNYNRYESHSSSSFDISYQVVRDYIDYIPAIYKDKVEEIGGWLIDHYFTKEEVTEGYKLAVDYSKVIATYESFRDESMKSAIVKAIGQKAFDDIYNFVLDHYEDTVGELIEELNSRGFVVKALYDAIQAVRVLNGEITEKDVVDFDSLILTVKDMKISAIIETVIQMMMSSMGGGGSSTHQDVPVQQHEQGQGSSGGGGPIDVSEEGGKKIKRAAEGMLPKTSEELKAMIDGFLEGNLFDLISAFSGTPKATMVAMADLVVNQLKEGHVSMTLKTSRDGGFLSLEYMVKNFGIEGLGELEYGYALMTKDYDKAQVLSDIQKEVDKFELNKAKFTLDDKNFEWYAKPFEDFYSKEYPGFKLSYEHGYFDGEYDALVSNVDVKSDDYYWGDQNEKVYPTGKLVLVVQQPSDWFGWVVDEETGETRKALEYNYGHVIKNYNGFGTLLGKDEIGLKQTSREYLDLAYVEGKDESQRTRFYYVDLPSFEYLYKVSDGTMHTTKAGGSYGYMQCGFYKPSLSTWEEWDAYEAENYPYSEWVPSESYGRYNDKDDYVVLKIVNQLDGRVDYLAAYKGESSTLSNLYQSYALSKDMNDEALESMEGFKVTYGLRDGKLVGYLDAFGYSISPFGSNYFDKSVVDNNFAETKTFGNVTATLTAPRGNLKCTRQFTWKVTCGGKTVISGSYKLHLGCYEYEKRGEDQVTNIDPCHIKHQRDYTCTICNKVMYSSTWTEENHNWSEFPEYIVTPTLTCAGIVRMEEVCSKCGERITHYRYQEPCDHLHYTYDEDTHMITCQDCGYKVESEDGSLPAIIYEPYDDGSPETMSFSMYAPRYYGWSLNYYYSFNLCAGYFDNDGNFQVLANGNTSDIDFDIQYFSEEYEEYDIYGATFCLTLTFSKASYEALVAQAEADETKPEDAEIVPTIAAVSRDDSGQVFYYAIY